MSTLLKVLLVGDSVASDLVLPELERRGCAFASGHVQTGEAMQDALARGQWDVVISDFDSASFSSADALTVLRNTGQDLPFIVVAAPAGEEAAVAALKSGAHDFVSKTNLARLVPAVERELRAVQSRREHALTRDALLQSEARHRSLIERLTERCRLQDRVRQAQKMESIGHLAGGIAHDFNNLLTAILGYSELLTEQIGPDTQTGRDLREIMTAAGRARALTRQLLAFSRRQVSTLAPLDVNAIVAGLRPMLRHLSGDRITVETRPASQLHPVMADAVQIEQVLINLAVNARDAMAGGGTLTIETGHADVDDAFAAAHGGRGGGWALVTVRDTGVGMTPEVSDRIFEPFFTTKERGHGTGLGLAAVHGIVTQLGGWIRVESEIGEGTAFHVYLPETDQAVPRERARTVLMSAAGNETILLVEDEDAVREFVRTVLERFGYGVLEAPDAETALSLAAAHTRIDLLLTDVILPKMDGPELARRVSNLRPSARVLFMSGCPERMAAADGVLEPGRELLEKPFTAQAILSRVRELVGGELPSR